MLADDGCIRDRQDRRGVDDDKVIMLAGPIQQGLEARMHQQFGWIGRHGATTDKIEPIKASLAYHLHHLGLASQVSAQPSPHLLSHDFLHITLAQVSIDDQHLFAPHGQGGGKVGRYKGFA
ncbi:hypothetical protein D3C72_307340 [compost metagenome]